MRPPSPRSRCSLLLKALSSHVSQGILTHADTMTACWSFENCPSFLGEICDANCSAGDVSLQVVTSHTLYSAVMYFASIYKCHYSYQCSDVSTNISRHHSSHVGFRFVVAALLWQPSDLKYEVLQV